MGEMAAKEEMSIPNRQEKKENPPVDILALKDSRCASEADRPIPAGCRHRKTMAEYPPNPA